MRGSIACDFDRCGPLRSARNEGEQSTAYCVNNAGNLMFITIFITIYSSFECSLLRYPASLPPTRHIRSNSAACSVRVINCSQNTMFNIGPLCACQRVDGRTLIRDFVLYFVRLLNSYVAPTQMPRITLVSCDEFPGDSFFRPSDSAIDKFFQHLGSHFGIVRKELLFAATSGEAPSFIDSLHHSTL